MQIVLVKMFSCNHFTSVQAPVQKPVLCLMNFLNPFIHPVSVNWLDKY